MSTQSRSGARPTARMAAGRERPLGLVAAGLALIAVTYGLARYAYGLFLPELREEFALSAASLGLIGAGAYASYCLAVGAALVLTARMGPRRMAVLAGTFAVAGTATVAAAPTGWVLGVGIFVAGISSGLASPPLGEAVTRAIAERRRDWANSIINSGTSVGVALSGPVALLASGSWRLAWLGFALIAAVVLAWNARVLPGPVRAARGGRRGIPRLSAGYLIGHRSLPMFVAALAVGFGSAAYWTFSRDLVVYAGGVSLAGSTLFWTVLGVSGLAGGAAGTLVGRFGLTPTLRGSLLAMAAANALLAAAPGNGMAAYASAAVFGASFITLSGIILVWAVAAFPARPSAGIGAGFLLLAVGQVAGAPAAGALADAIGLAPTFAAFAAASLVAAGLRAEVRRGSPCRLATATPS